MRKWKLIVPLALALVFAFVVERSRPRPLNWTPTFASRDKIPLGTYALYKSLKDIFPTKSLERRNRPIYNWEGKNHDYANRNLLFITRQFSPEQLDIKRLLLMADAGATVFISAQNIARSLQDTLGFKIMFHSILSDPDSFPLPPAYPGQHPIHLKTLSMPRFFGRYDSLTYTSILDDSLGKSIFITRPFGHGRFYLHCQPYVFTNYNFFSKGITDYLAATLSRLPLRPVLWDEYYKLHITGFQRSPLHYILNDPVLGPVYYLALLGAILFVIINGRRKQRPIPIIEPYKNESLNYLKTLAGLYRQGENLLSAARIRRRFVLNFIREHFHLETRTLDARFSAALQQKSNLPRLTVYELVRHLRNLDHTRRMDNAQFKEFNLWLERFYHELETHKN